MEARIDLFANPVTRKLFGHFQAAGTVLHRTFDDLAAVSRHETTD
ncbi:hypothetical protein SFUMM280S_06722 [Streptomyces fumanus]